MASKLHQITLRANSGVGFNRRMRKTACPLVWEGVGSSPAPTRSLGQLRIQQRAGERTD